MAQPPLISLSDVGVIRGTGPIFSHADLHVYPRDKIAIVGPNGSGKSSLMGCLSGHIPADQGEVFIKPGLTTSVLEQNILDKQSATLLETLQVGLDDSEFGRLNAMLNNLGLTGEEQVTDCSGGQIRRAQLALCLSRNADILLLDEPTNHLDLVAITWLEAHLKSRKETLVLISHDRQFLEKLSERLFWVDRGNIRVRDVGYSQFLDVQEEQFKQEEEQARLRKRKLRAEEDWMRYGVTARRKRNVRRLEAYHALKSEVRQDRRQDILPELLVGGELHTGQKVCSMHNVHKKLGDTLLIEQLDLEIKRGERLAIVGPNGVGKTTLLKLITGDVAPDNGTIKLGANVVPVLVDQMREGLRLDFTVHDNVTGGAEFVDVAGERLHYQRYLQGFGLRPNRHHLRVEALSGGERARVLLAKRLLNPSGFLLLDEPTNDLDIETIERLEDLIEQMGLTVVFVSHDRKFVDHLATGLVVFKGQGKWQREAGSDMQRHFLQPSDDAAPKSQRTKPTAGKNHIPAPTKSKMSYKDQRELDLLPEQIENLANRITQIEKQLSDPTLFQENPNKFEALSHDLAQSQRQLQVSEERWLELETMKEELEQSA